MNAQRSLCNCLHWIRNLSLQISAQWCILCLDVQESQKLYKWCPPQHHLPYLLVIKGILPSSHWEREHGWVCTYLAISSGFARPIYFRIQHTAIHHCDRQPSSMIRQRWEEDQRCFVTSSLCTILMPHCTSDILKNSTRMGIFTMHCAPNVFFLKHCIAFLLSWYVHLNYIFNLSGCDYDVWTGSISSPEANTTISAVANMVQYMVSVQLSARDCLSMYFLVQECQTHLMSRVIIKHNTILF